MNRSWRTGTALRTLKSLKNRVVSAALPDTAATALGKAVAPRLAAHPGLSGIYPLLDSHDAFAARVLLAQKAERSLDVQYYIWHKDISGTLLFQALHEAADRGVRVRLLLDDNNTPGLDNTLAALNAHPNIQVRLFNPFLIRRPRWIGFLTDFFRMNRRMHNKSFTADNQVSIVGGRNVGDEYFGAAEGVLFVDLDVMTAGPVVNEVSRDFDRYWADASSYPAERLLPRADSATLADLASAASLLQRNPLAAAYLEALRESTFVQDLIEGHLEVEWAAAHVVSDDPAKGMDRAPRDQLLWEKLRQIIGSSATTVDLISPYFVPTAAGTTALIGLARRGVKIRLLTNSREATDVAVVHAGYAKRRRALLTAGIALYELRRLSPPPGKNKGDRRFGKSGSSLHAKAFSVDHSRVFVGSFNFDPRSANLNTEMGLVIDSPALAQRITATFETGIPANSYEVRLSDTGRLTWIERGDAKSIRHDTEPGTTAWQRARIALLSHMPIEWLM